MRQIGKRVATPVIIISYETFRLYTDILHRSEIGLVICDEVSIFLLSLNYLKFRVIVLKIVIIKRIKLYLV